MQADLLVNALFVARGRVDPARGSSRQGTARQQEQLRGPAEAGLRPAQRSINLSCAMPSVAAARPKQRPVSSSLQKPALLTCKRMGFPSCPAPLKCWCRRSWCCAPAVEEDRQSITQWSSSGGGSSGHSSGSGHSSSGGAGGSSDGSGGSDAGGIGSGGRLVCRARGKQRQNRTHIHNFVLVVHPKVAGRHGRLQPLPALPRAVIESAKS